MRKSGEWNLCVINSCYKFYSPEFHIDLSTIVEPECQFWCKAFDCLSTRHGDNFRCYSGHVATFIFSLI